MNRNIKIPKVILVRNGVNPWYSGLMVRRDICLKLIISMHLRLRHETLGLFYNPLRQRRHLLLLFSILTISGYGV